MSSLPVGTPGLQIVLLISGFARHRKSLQLTPGEVVPRCVFTAPGAWVAAQPVGKSAAIWAVDFSFPKTQGNFPYLPFRSFPLFEWLE